VREDGEIEVLRMTIVALRLVLAPPLASSALDAAELISKKPRTFIGNGSVARGSLLHDPAEKPVEIQRVSAR